LIFDYQYRFIEDLLYSGPSTCNQHIYTRHEECVDRRCVVFSNYDLLRCSSDNDSERNLQELAENSDVNLQFILREPRPCSTPPRSGLWITYQTEVETGLMSSLSGTHRSPSS